MLAVVKTFVRYLLEYLRLNNYHYSNHSLKKCWHFGNFPIGTPLFSILTQMGNLDGDDSESSKGKGKSKRKK